jgi:hypothetical protein
MLRASFGGRNTFPPGGRAMSVTFVTCRSRMSPLLTARTASSRQALVDLRLGVRRGWGAQTA